MLVERGIEVAEVVLAVAGCHDYALVVIYILVFDEHVGRGSFGGNFRSIGGILGHHKADGRIANSHCSALDRRILAIVGDITLGPGVGLVGIPLGDEALVETGIESAVGLNIEAERDAGWA